jgi:hypothetical protein
MSKCFQDNDALQADYFFFPTPILRKRSIASLGAKSSAMSFSACVTSASGVALASVPLVALTKNHESHACFSLSFLNCSSTR